VVLAAFPQRLKLGVIVTYAREKKKKQKQKKTKKKQQKEENAVEKKSPLAFPNFCAIFSLVRNTSFFAAESLLSDLVAIAFSEKKHSFDSLLSQKLCAKTNRHLKG
jgi:hypothetical protein